MNFKRGDVILIFLLIFLNLILRIPWTPHEIGWDSFSMHTLINSISAFGEARWWIHPTSIAGSYPYSYASAFLFLLSGISQASGIDTEIAILLYNFILGSTGIFFAYILAGIIWDNKIFKFFVAFIFSTSQGIVTFSTWTGNARTLFVILLPLFVYALLKTRRSKLRFGVLTFILFVLLNVTHHYIYYLIPLLVTYFGVIVLYSLHKTIKKVKPIKIPENFISIFLLGAFLTMFIVSFFTRTFIEADPWPLGSRYAWIFVMIEGYTRYIGVPIVFAISGYIYLIFKKEKTFEEFFLLLSIAAIAPLLYVPTYTKWFIITFASLLIGIGLTNVTDLNIPSKMKKYRNYFMIIFLVFSMTFVSYYQFLHFLNDPSPRSRYMEESTYEAANWIKRSIDENVISQPYITDRILSISEVPLLSGFGPSDLAYGFASPEDLKVEQLYNPASLEFYTRDPYKATGIRTDWVADNIVYKQWAKRLISRFNISYYVENKDMPTELDLLVRNSDDKVYDNGKIKIWDLT